MQVKLKSKRVPSVCPKCNKEVEYLTCEDDGTELMCDDCLGDQVEEKERTVRYTMCWSPKS